MKRSIISLLTIVSLSLASVQAMEQKLTLYPTTSIRIPILNKNIDISDWKITKYFTQKVLSSRELRFAPFLQKLSITTPESIVDQDNSMLTIVVSLIKKAHLLSTQGCNLYESTENLSHKIKNYFINKPKLLAEFIQIVDYLSSYILLNATARMTVNNRIKILKHLPKNLKFSFSKRQHRQEFYLDKKITSGSTRPKIDITYCVEDGWIQIPAEHELTHLEQIEESKRFSSFEDILCNKDYALDDYIAHLSFESKQVLLSYMVTWLRANIDFSKDTSCYIDFFNMQREGYVKMAMRFLYADANNGQLIDKMNIKNIWAALKSTRSGFSFDHCFKGNNDPLFTHLMKFIELAKPLYNNKRIYLDLCNNQLTSVPSEIGNLTTFITLNLSHNQLTSIPAEIGNLTALKVLWLENNRLKSIPSTIGNLTALKELYLYCNRLTNIPPTIGNLTALRKLYLYRNRLTNIPAKIGNLTALKKLALEDNQLKSIPPTIGKLTTLTGLLIGNNNLASIPAEIRNLTALTSLWLENNEITANDVPQALRDQLGNRLHI